MTLDVDVGILNAMKFALFLLIASYFSTFPSIRIIAVFP
jgi:hypothetical protein